MKNLNDFLLSIGLGKNETEVYTALINMGSSSVLTISKKTKIHRSNIYDVLRKLMERGLIFEIDSATKSFSARPPESLGIYLKEKEIELNEIIKEGAYLKSNQDKEVNLIKITKGSFAIRQVLNDFLEKEKMILAYGIPSISTNLIGPVLKDFHRSRIKKKIIMKHIFNSNATDRAKFVNKMKYCEAKVFPSTFDTAATTNISGDKVVIILWENEMSVIEIENKELAEVYRKYFEVLWSKAKRVD